THIVLLVKRNSAVFSLQVTLVVGSIYPYRLSVPRSDPGTDIRLTSLCSVMDMTREDTMRQILLR
ncbi:MAG: hypothetical protein LBH42_04425, partial [Treponema sp.]|nr:hypothetical protein [Treponema sp.]